MATATHAAVLETEDGNDVKEIGNGSFYAAKPKGRLENVDDVLHY